MSDVPAATGDGVRDATDAPATARWRVLIVDDSRDDAELTEFALREGGLAVECRVLYREADLRDALPAFAPQLVLCDVNLPAFSGAEALAIVRAHDAALPFLFVTGAEPLHPPGGDGLVLKDALGALPGMATALLAR